MPIACSIHSCRGTFIHPPWVSERDRIDSGPSRLCGRSSPQTPSRKKNMSSQRVFSPKSFLVLCTNLSIKPRTCKYLFNRGIRTFEVKTFVLPMVTPVVLCRIGFSVKFCVRTCSSGYHRFRKPHNFCLLHTFVWESIGSGITVF